MADGSPSETAFQPGKCDFTGRSGQIQMIAVALVGLGYFLLATGTSAAESRMSRGLGQASAGQPAAGLSSSRGLQVLPRSRGADLNVPTRQIRRHHFGDPKHRLRNRFFVPQPHFRHHVFRHHPGFHHGFRFGHRIIHIAPSSVVISSHPGIVGGFFNVAPSEAIPNEKPVISIMLRHRRDLGLSPEQVHELEELRDTYQRQAIRHDADLRIAELELQRVLKADRVDLELARVKLETIEHLKVELRLARLGAIEKGKGLLSPDQRATLSTLLGEAEYSRLRDERFSESTEDQP